MPALGFEDAKARIGTLGTAALLASAGGFLDAFTYVGHGHVFANAMTANVVLLGVNGFAGDWQTALSHLPPIVAFLMGVSASQAMQLRSKKRGVAAPYTSILRSEIAVLLVLSFLRGPSKDLLFTIPIAFAASVQVQTFREVNGRPYNSTFTTGNLRALSEAVFSWFLEGRSPRAADVARDFSAICAALLLGAAAGGFATPAFGNRALWCVILVLAITAVRVRRAL